MADLAKRLQFLHRARQLASAGLDALFQLGVGCLKLGCHVIEFIGQILEFVTCLDIDAMIQGSRSDARRPLSQDFDGAHHAASDEKTG